MTDAKARLLKMIADEPHMGGGGLLKAIGKAQKVAKAAEVAETGARAILPAAEREANLAKMLEGSKLKDRMYHGTGADITEFQPSKYGALGPGVYLTAQPKEASYYARARGQRNSDSLPNVLPVYAQARNPFHISTVNDSHAQFFKHFDPTGKLSDEEVMKLAREAGYDSIHADLEGVTNMFDPAAIKSAIGNQGTYDLSDPDITKAGGGLLKAVSKAQKAAKAAEEVKAMRLYHGSPHVMAPTPENPLGKFDPSKIGTGEGAQMYGSGHYLAQSRDVAKNYRPRSPKYEAKLVKEYKRAEAAQNYPKMEVLEDAMLHKAPDELLSKYSNAEEGYTPEHAKAAADYAKWYEANRPEVGGLYHVDLPQDYLANMLDYDKPIDQHPEHIKELLEKAGINTKTSATAGSMIGGQEALLSKHGIPGMAYDDTTGAGTRNFVVFPGNEDMLNIVQRDKEGGAVHMAGGGRTPKYPWERYEQPKKVAEMRAREINPIAGAVKSGADYATQLIDKGPSFANLVGDVVGAVPFVGPDLRKRMEASNISIPTDINLASNMPAEDYQHGQRMQYRKPGISTTSVPTKDVLEAIKVSDLVGTPGLSKVAEDIGYGQMPDALDLLDAANVGGLGYGAAKAGLKGGRKAAGALSDLAKSEAGYKLAQKALQYAPAAQPMNIVKEPGGNWLSGSVEKALQPLKTQRPTHRDEALMLGGRWANEVDDPAAVEARAKDAAFNKWIDSNLANYVKKQMATPDDPVRKLAEEGITHIPQGTRNPSNMRAVQATREAAGFPETMGKSDEAHLWEALSDKPISFGTAGEMMNVGKGETWMQKVDPFTRVHGVVPMESAGMAQNLGFDHIVDVLRQDLDAGRIRPEQLNKISMEQAVRRTHEYDQEMAKRMAAAQAKVTEGMPVHKEYPEGYKWIELSQPKELPEGWSQEPSGAYVGPKGERTTVNPNYETLRQALKYEGDTMGHCVGGYCPDVAGGRSRIFSLRDAKGEPHVTVETKPGAHPISYTRRGDNFPDISEMDYAGKYSFGSPYKPTSEQLEQIQNKAYELWTTKGTGRAGDINDYYQQAANEILGPMPEEIKQIKGKQNRAPKEDYLPYVQDFVKSGNWSDVGDLRNTGMRRTSDAFNENELNKIREAGIEVPAYATHEEIKSIGNQAFPGQYGDVTYAEGGDVDALHAKLRLIDMIHNEPHMAGGGLLKAIGKAQKTAKATEKAAEVAAKTSQVVPTPAAPVLIPGLMQKSTAAQIGREERARRQAAAAAEAARVEAAKQTPVPVGYVPHTPKSPNPHVGFRFEADEPVGITPSPTLDVGALERSHKGASMLPLPWDVTSRNVRVSSVSGEKLAHDIWTHGGIPYSSDEEHLLGNIGGASGRGIAERIQGREAAARAENKQAGGTGEILHAVNTMGTGSENYALPSSEFAVDVIGRRFMNGEISLKQAEDLSNLVRNYVDPKTKKQPFKNWGGFLSRDGVQQMYTGEGLNGPPGDLRKLIAENILYKKKNQELLGFNTEDFVNAITHAPLRGVGRGYIGGNLLSNVESSPMRLSKTADYPWLNPYDTNFSATHLGQLEDLVPIQAVMSRKIAPIEQELLAKQAAKTDGKPYTDASLQGSAISALEKRKENVSQIMDSRFFQDLADYYDALKTPLEKKKGGLAHSKKVKRHGNTVPN